MPRRITAILCTALLLVQFGCHTFLPLQETVPISEGLVGVELNDQGRALLSERLGSMVRQVDGTVVSRSDTSVTLSVTRIRFLSGSSAVWAGEVVEIPKVGVRGFRERQYSRGRTAMLTAGIVIGIVALAALFSFDVFGFDHGDDVDLPPDQQ